MSERMAQCVACESKGLECDNGAQCANCLDHGVPCMRGNCQEESGEKAQEEAEDAATVSDVPEFLGVTALADPVSVAPVQGRKTKPRRRGGQRNRQEGRGGGKGCDSGGVGKAVSELVS
jgi:hypothetical protein